MIMILICFQRLCFVVVVFKKYVNCGYEVIFFLHRELWLWWHKKVNRKYIKAVRVNLFVNICICVEFVGVCLLKLFLSSKCVYVCKVVGALFHHPMCECMYVWSCCSLSCFIHSTCAWFLTAPFSMIPIEFKSSETFSAVTGSPSESSSIP